MTGLWWWFVSSVVSPPATKPLNPRILSQTANTVTIAWTADPKCSGYQFSVDGITKSHTWNPLMSQTRFSKPPGGGKHNYGIAKITVSPRESVSA